MKRLPWSKIHDIIFTEYSSYVNMFCCFPYLPLSFPLTHSLTTISHLPFHLPSFLSLTRFTCLSIHPILYLSLYLKNPPFHHHHRKTWITRKCIFLQICFYSALPVTHQMRRLGRFHEGNIVTVCTLKEYTQQKIFPILSVFSLKASNAEGPKVVLDKKI